MKFKHVICIIIAVGLLINIPAWTWAYKGYKKNQARKEERVQLELRLKELEARLNKK